MVRLQIPKAGVQILQKVLARPGKALGGNKNILAHIGQGSPQFLLAVRIAPGCVKKADPPDGGSAFLILQEERLLPNYWSYPPPQGRVPPESHRRR